MNRLTLFVVVGLALVAPRWPLRAEEEPSDKLKQDALDALKGFYDDMGFRWYHWKSGEKVTEMDDFSNILQTWADTKRFQFGKTDKDCMGEYANKKVTIRNDSVNDLLQSKLGDEDTDRARTESPAAAGTRRFYQLFAVALSVVHEMQHARQVEVADQDATLPSSETEAYRHAMTLGEEWVDQMQRQFEASPDRKQALRVRGACQAWLDYRAEIQRLKDGASGISTFFGLQSPPDDEVFASWRQGDKPDITMEDKMRKMESLREEAKSIQRAIEVLEVIAQSDPVEFQKANLPKDRRVLTIKDLERFIPRGYSTEQEYEQLIAQASELAVKKGLGLGTDNPKNNLADMKQYAARGLRKAWDRARLERIKEFQGALAQLSGLALKLSCDPKNPEFDAKNPKLTVWVKAESQGLDSLIAELERKIFNSTGRPPKVTVTDCWIDPDGKEHRIRWPAAVKDRRYVFDTPGPHKVTLQRVIQTDAALVGPKQLDVDHPLRRSVTLTGEIQIQIKPYYPTDVAGLWKGPFILQNITAAGATQQEIQGCFGRLIGKPMDLECRLVPQNSMSGRMTATVTPPAGAGAAKVALNGTYQFGNGVFSASCAVEEGTMTLQGAFAYRDNTWTLKGSWSWSGTANGQKSQASGTWSVSNSRAR